MTILRPWFQLTNCVLWLIPMYSFASMHTYANGLPQWTNRNINDLIHIRAGHIRSLVSFLNSLAPERCHCDHVIFKLASRIDILSISNAIVLMWMPLWLVIIGSGNGLEPSGNNPLPGPRLTQIYVAIWCHRATMNVCVCVCVCVCGEGGGATFFR